ncbi:hypothetical protein Taro_018170 [Colocasia esculenta]|uniref:Uncharacterized protein n=1 Tax=Colocasia esculenta TaxID=4460 RepID=A0A843UT55_COLES|nr:hypothetical protein [Colocasia esculenta]
MVCGGRSGRESTLSSAPSTSVGRRSMLIGIVSPTMPVVSTTRSVSRPVASPIPSHSVTGRESSSSGGGGSPVSLTPTMLDFWRHELEHAPTFHELFDRTRKRKGTDDYVSESARTIVETYDKTMADCYAEGTPQPDLDLEAWVDVAGWPRKGRVYGFGDSLDTTPVLSSYVSSVAPPA